MRETVTGGWRLRGQSRALDSPRGLGQSCVSECDQKSWPGEVADWRCWLGWPGRWRIPSRAGRCSRSAGAGLFARRGVRQEGWRLFGLAFLASLVSLIGLAAVSIKHPAHGRCDRRLAGIERVRGVVLGGMGLDLWCLVSCGLADQNGRGSSDFALVYLPLRSGWGLRCLSPGAWWLSVEFLGVTQFENNPLIQIAAFTGVYGSLF